MTYIVKESGVGDDQIQGCMKSVLNIKPDKLDQALSETYVYEESSGGLGAIDSVFALYNKQIELEDAYNLINDYIIRMGECLIGVPELLVRTAIDLYCKGSSSDLKTSLNDAASVLNIIITYDELEQSYILLQSLISELINLTNGKKDEAIELLIDIFKAVRDLEKHLSRTPTLNEIAFWILLNINNYKRIKDIIIEKAAKIYMVYYRNRNLENTTLEQAFQSYLAKVLYKTSINNLSDAKKFIQRFINDFNNIFKGSSTLAVLILSENSKLFSATIYLARLIHNMVKTMFYRGFLISCRDSCGWCLINIRGCNIARDPTVQINVLSWRILKLFLSYLIEKMKANSQMIEITEEKEYKPSDKTLFSIIAGNNVYTLYWRGE